MCLNIILNYHNLTVILAVLLIMPQKFEGHRKGKLLKIYTLIFFKQWLGVKELPAVQRVVQNWGGIHYLHIECIILSNTGDMFRF